MGNNYVSLGKLNYLGKVIDYELNEDTPSFIEQSNMDDKLSFMDWKEDDTDMVDNCTVVIWYPKGKRPPFAHKKIINETLRHNKRCCFWHHSYHYRA
jgi:5,10-methenyltetrahydromethanopterin hydrogenase